MSSAMEFLHRVSAMPAHRDAARAFATLTLIDSAANDGHKLRFCLENLAPAQYERCANELQQRLRDDAAQRRPAMTLNERAHVSVVVIDIDDGSPSQEAALYAAAQVRLAFAVHFGVASAVYVAMRTTARGAHKYHIYLPGVLHTDKAVLDAVLWLAQPSVRIDRQPTEQRHLRMHGTDRRETESGRFEGAGIYRLIGGFDERGAPLPLNYEPHPSTGCWHSVRAGEHVVRRLLLEPHSAYPRAVTSVAQQMLAARQGRALAIPSAVVAAAAGGDDAREVALLLSASDARWFVVSSRLCCTECGDDGERTEHRCLARLEQFVDGAGNGWLMIYRWSLCLGCCQNREVQALTPVVLSVADLVDAHGEQCCPPRLEADDNDIQAPASQSNLLHLPIEVVYPAGFGVVEARTGQCVVSVGGARRVPPQYTLEATSVCELARQLLACTPGRHVLSGNAIVESRVRLSVADCTAADASGVVSVNLGNGLLRADLATWSVPAGAHGIELWAAPCACGKTESAIRHMKQLLAADERLLVIAPRVTLCCQLHGRLRRAAATDGRQHHWHERVRSYKEVDPRRMDDVSVLIVTLESLHKFLSVPFAGVIVDEFCTVVHALHGETTKKRRLTTLDAFVRTLAHARHTIVMDRDIAAGERLFVAHVVAHMQHSVRWPRTNVIDAEVRAPPVYVRHVEMDDPVRRTIELWSSTNQLCANMQQELHGGKNIALFCATKRDAEGFYEMFKNYFGDATVITGDTDADEKHRFALQPDEHFAVQGTRVWIYTTTASVGLSVDKPHFHEVYVIGADFLSLRALLQAEARVRTLNGQPAGVRRIHLCLPSSVYDRTAQVLADRMPTVGSVVTAHEYALRHTRAVDATLAQQQQQQPEQQQREQLEQLVRQFVVPAAVEIDAEQLYQPIPLLLLTLAAMEAFESQMTRVIFEHWCVDANVCVIVHVPPAEPERDIHIVAARTSRRVGAKKRDAKRALSASTASSTALPAQKRLRGTDKQMSTHLQVWMASLVCDSSLLSNALLTRQRRDGGAVAAIAPLSGIALLGKLALQFLGRSCVLRGEAAPAEKQWRIEHDCGVALSPRDGRAMMTVEQFFEYVTLHGLIGGRNRSELALVPTVTGFADHFRNLSRRNKAGAAAFDTERKRTALLEKIVRACYGDVQQPDHYMASLARWLASDDQSHLYAIREQLFSAPTLAMLEAAAAKAGATRQLLLRGHRNV